jgi:signal transduction histidine kinase
MHFRHRDRPPWWPADEPWPPSRSRWHKGPRRFFWRVGCTAGLLFLLIFTMLATIFWLVGQLLGLVSIPARSYLWVFPLGLATFILSVASSVIIARSLRRTILPVTNILEAAQQVAEGDFSVRVAERGPRDVRRIAQVFNAMVTRLQSSADQRRGLLADVTHELRTPLTIIQGNLEGLIDGVYPADETHLRLMLAETATLSRLIDDLRTLALAESGALQLRKEPTDLGQLVRDLAASFRVQADTAGVSIHVELPEDLPLVAVDPARIREAVANLTANALRYTPAGESITLRCVPEHTADGAHLVAVSVEDAGAGIAPEDLPHVFDRFYKASDSGGMGLGLAITKNLIAAHGGQIDAESEPGKRTIIRFTLPADSD